MKNNKDKITLREIFKEVLEAPSEWVLVVGDALSYNNAESRRKRLVGLLENCMGVSGRKEFYQCVEMQDYAGLAGALFGNVWDGISFLEKDRRRQMERRMEFASGMVCKEKMNLELVDIHMETLLKVFSGVVLSVRQDELLEAFLENELSMSIEDYVWTPHSVMLSPKWNQWRENRTLSQDKTLSQDINMPDNIGIKEHVLVKLYGSCREPSRMLLSEQDFELYYPADSDEDSCIRFLVEKLFESKNLFFLELDAEFGSNGSKEKRMPFAPGISVILEKTANKGKRRYIYAEKNMPDMELGKYGIQSISEEEGFNHVLEEIWKETKERREAERLAEGTVNEPDEEPSKESAEKSSEESVEKSVEESVKEAAAGEEETEMPVSRELSRDEAEQRFWELYSRRRRSRISASEVKILKEKILGTEDNRWSEKSISLLALAANRQADFYDLETVFAWAVEEKTKVKVGESYELVLRNLFNEKLGEKSLELLRILSSYGEGFPAGFLSLILQEGEELREWKEAGIQLVNSGIYVQRHYRNHLYRRMEYADSVIKTAGARRSKRLFTNVVEKVEHQIDDSYFYPFDKSYFSLSDIGLEEPEYLQKVKDRFQRMFQNLKQILKNRSEGYGHIYSLLETELPAIIRKVEEADDETLEWKPELLYYLLRDSSLMAFDREMLKKQLHSLLEKVENLSEGQGTGLQLLCGKMMLLQTLGVIESQSSQKKSQEDALVKCDEAEEVLKKAQESLQTESQAVVIPEELFIQGIQISFLKCKIYGRISTIAEIERCAQKDAECKEQKAALVQMNLMLDKIEGKLKEREKAIGGSYKELWAEWHCRKGEYGFKMSQYEKENREFNKQITEVSKAEKDYYYAAEEAYKQALQYYESYPYRYWMQCACVMRNLADLYCWKSMSYQKALNGNEEKEYRKMREKCYHWLADSYYLYRSHADLHGIADVLQSMGNVEDFSVFDESAEKEKRSSFCFYNVSIEFYKLLGDSWSEYVVKNFKEGAKKERS